MVKSIDNYMEKIPGQMASFEMISQNTGLNLEEVLELYKAGRIGRYDSRLLIKCVACSAETKQSNRKGLFCTKCAQQMCSGEGSRKPVNDPDKIQVQLRNFEKDIYHTKKTFSDEDRIKYGFKRSYED